MMEKKKSTKEKLTDELKKNIALFTQIGVIVSMLVGAVVWVNSQLDLSGKFADRIAQQASERVVAEFDPLTRSEFYNYQDSVALGYNTLAMELLSRFENRMNRQDSLMLLMANHKETLGKISNTVLRNSFTLDTLRVGVGESRDAVIDEVVERYREDSLHTYINKLQAEYRFNKLMTEIRTRNAKVMNELRDGKKGFKLFRKRPSKGKRIKIPIR